jgi:hypothetical protein
MGGASGALAAFFDGWAYYCVHCHLICAMKKKNGVGLRFLPKVGSTRTVLADGDDGSSEHRGTSSDVEEEGEEDVPSSTLLLGRERYARCDMHSMAQNEVVLLLDMENTPPEDTGFHETHGAHVDTELEDRDVFRKYWL